VSRRSGKMSADLFWRGLPAGRAGCERHSESGPLPPVRNCIYFLSPRPHLLLFVILSLSKSLPRACPEPAEGISVSAMLCHPELVEGSRSLPWTEILRQAQDDKKKGIGPRREEVDAIPNRRQRTTFRMAFTIQSPIHPIHPSPIHPIPQSSGLDRACGRGHTGAHIATSMRRST
jgi:hypothetical protein